LLIKQRKAVVKDFRAGWGRPVQARVEMVIPQIQYLTNDSWEEISVLDETNGWPILHSASYGGGALYVLTIPESFTDLYNLPPTVLNRIRQTLCRDMLGCLQGPGEVSLFVYDNNTFIGEPFLDEPVDVQVVTDEQWTNLKDIITGQTVTANPPLRFRWGRAPGKSFNVVLLPHSYRVFEGQ
jgi:hypothetical protein